MGRGDSSTAELIKPQERTRPRRGRRPTLDREATHAQFVLRVFDNLRVIAESESGKTREKVEKTAWKALDEAEPIRVLYVEQLLNVSGQTVRDWIERGVLEEAGSSPKRVTLSSAIRTKLLIDELRDAGRDRDLVNAVLDRIESDELKRDDRFQKSLEEMRRGERGEWPEGFEV